jgi:hypothetical protein
MCDTTNENETMKAARGGGEKMSGHGLLFS